MPNKPLQSASSQLADLLPMALLEIISKGIPAVGPDGGAVYDAEGNQIFRPAPASYFANAIKLLAQAGITPGQKTEDLARELEQMTGVKLRLTKPAAGPPDGDDPMENVA
jgi:hypothetical protein